METKQLLLSLAGMGGVSGDEKRISDAVKELLGEYMPCEVDAFGSVKGKSEGKGPRILLDAHMDKVGLIVKSITEDGFLLFEKCGGTDLRVMTGCEVTVYGKEELFGMISSIPPHLIRDKDKSLSADLSVLAIDVGMSYEKVRKLVSIGDRASYRPVYHSLENGLLCGPAFDDRCCMAAILLCLERLKKDGIQANLSVQFTAGEECGMFGAKTAAFDSDADEGIAVDVGFARQPGVKNEEGCVLSGGGCIGFSPVLDRALTLRLIETAKRNGIPYQTEAMGDRSHTNADAVTLTKGGIPCALISVPLRSMHTACETISIRDIENVALLLSEYIRERSGENA